MKRATPRPRNGEAGFTLVELLMTIALLGIIGSALAAAVMVTLGPDDQAADRLAAAQDSQLAALWIPDDIQSADPLTAADTTSGSTITCSGGEPVTGHNVLRLVWSQAAPTIATFAVSYRVVDEDGERRLVRFSCRDGGAVERLVVAHRLAETSPPTDAVQVATAGRRVTVRIDSSTGVVTTITGLRRTPSTTCVASATLSHSSVALNGSGQLSVPVTVTVGFEGPCTTLTLVGGPSTLTVGAGTTALPSSGWTIGSHDLILRDASLPGIDLDIDTLSVDSEPCAATLTPTPASVSLTATNDLAQEVTVTIATTGPCGALELAYERSPVDTEQVVAFSSGTAVIPVTGPWTPGTVALDVRAQGNGANAGSGTIEVTPFTTCTVTAVTPNPSSVARLAGGDLAQPVDVTVSTTGTCLALELVYRRDPADPDIVAPLGTGPYTATIPVAGPWTAGSVTLDVRTVGTTTPLGTGTLTVTAPCAVQSVVASPSSVARVPGSGGSARILSQSVSVQVTTTGTCTGLRLGFRPSNPPSATVVNLGGSGSAWTFTIPGNGASGAVPWSTGPHALDVLPASSTAVLGSGSLTVT